jgi:hypothetical protein
MQPPPEGVLRGEQKDLTGWGPGPMVVETSAPNTNPSAPEPKSIFGDEKQLLIQSTEMLRPGWRETLGLTSIFELI